MKNFINTDNLQTKKGFVSFVLPGLTIFAFLLIWQLVTVYLQIEHWILPAPLDVFLSLWSNKALIVEHSIQTIIETIAGLALAVLLGIVIATIIDRSEIIKSAIYPLLVISQTIPIIALAPLLMIWFGYGILPKIMVVTLVCFFPIAINLADGYRQIDKDMLRLMKSMGASNLQVFKMVKLPGALPYFFSGLRIAGTYSVMGAVIGEWLGASKGLGILLTRSSQSFLTDRVFATIFVIVCLSLMIFILIEILGRVIMPWNYQGKRFILKDAVK
ncbi:ABC transporter permease [Bacillus timonensis]|nr:ABC transporter permease [Bacillus timonensis]